MNEEVRLGDRVGLIGDVHGQARFLHEAVVTLASRGCTSLVQLGDFGMIWRGKMGSHLALLPHSDLVRVGQRPSAGWQGQRASTGACGCRA
ncbi:hypothetical protein ACF08M_30180 [Streptomyces sp. NPDC015032]|uniref:hypothetical protein n=1 Tax=Streptomyces sp. NPDC015032 TaxID=3364937 RepID=UPI0037011AE2